MCRRHNILLTPHKRSAVWGSKYGRNSCVLKARYNDTIVAYLPARCIPSHTSRPQTAAYGLVRG